MTYAIVVELDIDPVHFETFVEKALINAKSARETEPDCLQFLLTTQKMAPNKVVLFEQYRNEEALEFHRQTAHFKAMQAATVGMVLNRRVMHLDARD